MNFFFLIGGRGSHLFMYFSYTVAAPNTGVLYCLTKLFGSDYITFWTYMSVGSSLTRTSDKVILHVADVWRTSFIIFRKYWYLYPCSWQKLMTVTRLFLRLWSWTKHCFLCPLYSKKHGLPAGLKDGSCLAREQVCYSWEFEAEWCWTQKRWRDIDLDSPHWDS